MPTGVYVRSKEWKEKQSKRPAVGLTRKCRKFGPHSKEHREKIAKAHKGKKRPPFSKEWLEKLSLSHSGKRNGNWKNGSTAEIQLARSSKKYKLWRMSVFERDMFTCQECGASGVYLEAHHIKSFAEFKELRYLLSNGITLCVDCHKKTDNYGKKGIQQRKA